MARRSTRSSPSDSDQGITPVASPALVVSPPTAPPEPRVRIRNVLGQMVQCSVLNEDGKSQTLRLGAHGVSQPYAESRIDNYTRLLVERGHLKIEPAH